MSYYINRDDVNRALYEYQRRISSELEYGKYDGIEKEVKINTVDHVSDEIAEIPAADVVEVVRCEECIYKHKDDTECEQCGDKISDDCYYCTRWGRCTRIWGFCSYGERKENE